MKTTYGYDWHVFDWKDKDVRHLDEVYIAVAVLLTLGMLIGAVVLLGLGL